MYKWKEEYQVGNDLIDEQHKCLMTLSQELMDQIRCGTLTVDVDTKLDQLFTYALEHFNAEEALMVAYKYPDIEKHKMQHDDFKIQLKKLSDSMAEDKRPENIMSIAQFTMKWVLNHIMKSDMAYKPYLRG